MTFGAATLSIALLVPAGAKAQSWSADGVNAQSHRNEGMPMVGTRGAIEKTLDARKVQTGAEFQVKLADTAKLAGGEVLPSGTILMGKVTQDDRTGGNTTLALRIDQASMKDGKAMPVAAYIVGIFPASGTGERQATAVTPGNQGPNPWREGIRQVDEKDALKGVDLHSKVGDNNSAVLVSRKDDIKMKSGTELALAIASPNSQESSGAGGH
jgi:hypothetical protein